MASQLLMSYVSITISREEFSLLKYFNLFGILLNRLPVLFPVSEEYPVAFHFLVLTHVVFCSAHLVQSVNELARKITRSYVPTVGKKMNDLLNKVTAVHFTRYDVHTKLN